MKLPVYILILLISFEMYFNIKTGVYQEMEILNSMCHAWYIHNADSKQGHKESIKTNASYRLIDFVLPSVVDNSSHKNMCCAETINKPINNNK